MASEQEGREEWVPPGRLKVPWPDVLAFVQSEQRWAAVRDVAYLRDTPIGMAIGMVLDTLRDWQYADHGMNDGTGILLVQLRALDRRRVGRRLDPGRVRPLSGDRTTLDLAGYAEYGYCASHSRVFWGLRLHLVATLHGLPVGFALTGAKADERHVLLSVLAADPSLLDRRHSQVVIADKNYYGREFEASLQEIGLDLLRPARKGDQLRAGDRFFRPLRQTVEPIFDMVKGQLDLEAHGGHTITGVAVRVYQRLLALTAAIWHNDHTGQPVKRFLLAYDH